MGAPRENWWCVPIRGCSLPPAQPVVRSRVLHGQVQDHDAVNGASTRSVAVPPSATLWRQRAVVEDHASELGCRWSGTRRACADNGLPGAHVESIYIYIYIYIYVALRIGHKFDQYLTHADSSYTQTHTHTHTHIYIYVCVWTGREGERVIHLAAFWYLFVHHSDHTLRYPFDVNGRRMCRGESCIWRHEVGVSGDDPRDWCRFFYYFSSPVDEVKSSHGHSDVIGIGRRGLAAAEPTVVGRWLGTNCAEPDRPLR